MLSAICPAVVPAGTSRTLASGSVIRIVELIVVLIAPRAPPAARAASWPGIDEVEHQPDQQQRAHEQPAAQLRTAGGRTFLAHVETFEGARFLRLTAENVNLTAFGIFT